MVQLGQHAPPIHTIAHVSDTHLLGGGRALYGAVDTDAHLILVKGAVPGPAGGLVYVHTAAKGGAVNPSGANA